MSQKEEEQPQGEQSQAEIKSEEEIPDHFYDSDIASVNEKDFMSDHEPPKDVVFERKLLHKEKLLHIFKTIVRVGKGIDKPAPYDHITLRYREELNIPTKKTEENLQYQASKYEFIQGEHFQTYNLGLKHEEIERLVTSMKQGEAAMFELEELEVSKKSNIKVLRAKRVFQIEVQDWTTVIDIDSDLKYLKYMVHRGEGPHRVSKFDEVSFSAEISIEGVVVSREEHQDLRLEEEEIASMPEIVWKILSSMKRKEIGEVTVLDAQIQELFLHSNHASSYLKMKEQYEAEAGTSERDPNTEPMWKIRVRVADIQKIDDFYLDGSILKKTLIRGVSTAKPDSTSLMYYALKFLGPKKEVLHEDACFNSDWWEDYGKLDQLGCRKVFMDEYKISKFLKASMKRMKPAEVAEVECRDMGLFRYGQDFEECRKLWPVEEKFPPAKVFFVVRVYNFTEGLSCFNLTLEGKIEESRRKKPVAVSLLNQGKIKKAYKRFQSIVALYSSGDINQIAYEEKVSALMNSILCLMKEAKYAEMISLCDLVLEEPKHGFDQDKMKIKGPQGFKVEGKVKSSEQEPEDGRVVANLAQNPKIIDKCLYRKALALLRTGESKLALGCLQQIKEQSEEVQKLEVEARAQLEQYEQKSKKIFQSMFS